MNDKTFWSILGVILGGWLLLFFFLIFNGKMADYAEARDSLQAEVGKMQKYAKNGPDKLPTAKLLEVRERELERQKAAVEAAESFFANREAKLASELPPTPARWGALYLDAFEGLKERYGELPGTRSEEGVIDFDVTPFEPREIDGDALAIVDRMWRTEAFLLDFVIRAKGVIDEVDGRVKSDSRSSGDDEGGEHVYFTKQKVEATVRIPPTQVGPLISGILEHDELMLEIASLEVEKDPDALIHEFVLPEGEKIEEEPNVVVSLTIDVLQFHPKQSEE